MNLTPLLLTSRIPKLITPPMRPDVLRNLLPRDLGRTTQTQRRIRANGNRFAEKLDLH